MENIESYLPQRPPFLFVDDVKIEGETIRGYRKFRPDEWFFQGHFPGYPIVPGVLLVESMAQAGGVGAKLLGIKPKSLFVFAKIRSATFKQQVRPDDTLEMEIVNVKSSGLVLLQKGVGKVDGQVAIEAEWIAMASGVPE
jgi:3-hydroxyacyl-[acyl-carrier-protein] dehydratase